MNRKKVMVVFGTRPEAIKMCPLVKELKKRNILDTIVCVTGQHREMLDQVLEAFGVIPDFDLSIMKSEQTLFDITISILEKMKTLLEEVKPDMVLVHGDTSTSFACALACFYKGIKVGHVEAGLRTYDMKSPYPEEFNRQAVDIVSDVFFAPTYYNRQNLINEGKTQDKIFVTGNTVIDALKTTVRSDFKHEILDWAGDKKLILMTVHRRENLGNPMREIFRSVNELLNERDDIRIIFPMHKNPEIRELIKQEIRESDRIRLTEPLDVLEFHNFLSRAYLVLTDSGGIQEEAASLGIPVLVLRDTTERPEGIDSGVLKLVGCNRDDIIKNVNRLLDDGKLYDDMKNGSSAFGTGNACELIADILEKRI